jgi:hypothetical protein
MRGEVSETSATPPEGAKAKTVNDIISQPIPERIEAVEIWTFTSMLGVKFEPIMVRTALNEKAVVQHSPLDGSILGVLIELRDGTDKNEIKRRRFFPGANFTFEQEFHDMPHYKPGDSPLERELKLKSDKKLVSMQEKVAKLAAGLDREDEDIDD